MEHAASCLPGQVLAVAEAVAEAIARGLRKPRELFAVPANDRDRQSRLWPLTAIAPPFTLVFFKSSLPTAPVRPRRSEPNSLLSNARWHPRTCAANASLSSMAPMSSSVTPLASRTLAVA